MMQVLREYDANQPGDARGGSDVDGNGARSCMIGREIVGVKMDDRGIGDSQRRDVACPNRKCLHLDFLLCAPYAANNANPNLLQLLFRMAKWGRTRKTKEP